MSTSPYLSVDQEKSHFLYVALCVVFTTTLVLSNMTLKVFYFPWFPNFPLTTGIITYPITFLITDIVSEIMGDKKAKFMVLMAFCMNLLMIIFTQVTLALPSHAKWLILDNPFGYTSVQDYQRAFSSVFSINGFIFIGSMIAFLIAQLLDIKLFCVIRKKYKGKHLWLRNNVSTCISQLIDTFIMNGIVLTLGLGLDLSTCGTIILSEYIYKVIFALLDTPFIYLFIYIIKKRFRIYENLQTT
ncbi:MAG: queuosine precursor transporter [Chlamydiae bacterium]|nr:queuosine precursor transporter [Chlamydiota bacterium]